MANWQKYLHAKLLKRNSFLYLNQTPGINCAQLEMLSHLLTTTKKLRVASFILCHLIWRSTINRIKCKKQISLEKGSFQLIHLKYSCYLFLMLSLILYILFTYIFI